MEASASTDATVVPHPATEQGDVDRRPDRLFAAMFFGGVLVLYVVAGLGVYALVAAVT